MKDKTKHLIAKELYFFFKWFLIVIIPGIILVILISVLFGTGFVPEEYYPKEFALTLTYGSPIHTALIAYMCRLYKWIMKWK